MIIKKLEDHWTSRLVGGSKWVVSAVITIALLMAASHGLNTYIDNRIEKKINDFKFLRKFAHAVRPSVVFDQKGSILADMGAMAYIDNIEVEIKDGDLVRVVVSPKVFLGIAPLLECLDGEFGIIVDKGKKYDWVYELKSIDTIFSESSGRITNYRFRIEVLK